MPPPPRPSFAAVTRTAWFILRQLHSSLRRAVLRVVLPLSLLPPAMFYYAGTFHGDDFMPGFADRDWLSIAAIFFAAELATVAAMGRFIEWIARVNHFVADRTSAYFLAFAAAIPLWISSLALAVPSLVFAGGVGLLALGLSGVVIYHGVATLLRVKDDVVAGSIAFGIMACGLLAWGMLLVIVLPLG